MIPDWLRHGAVYQVYPRSFQDSGGDGVGDLPGLLARLDHLVDLGVAAVWLSPVHPSPMADFGYDIADYTGVDPLFGTQADLDALIAACHARGLRVLLDGVFNHTSDQHPWFTASRSSREDPRRSWYIWRDGRGDRPPNGWASTMGGPAWTRDPATGQWYLHSFLPSQPDLNWREPAVQRAVLDVLAHWFERGVDGFRLDVFNCYRKHPDLPDNPRRWHPGGLVYGYIGQHHVNDRDQDDLAEVLAAMRAVADRHGAVLVGETLDERFVYDQAARWVGPDRLHQAFHFGLLHARWTAASLRAGIRAWSDALGPDGWPTWVLSNHDFPRFPTRWGGGDARAKAALTLGLTLRGTPYLYQGDELGLPDARLKRAEIVDPPGKRFWPFFKGRDGARTPMPWDGSAHGGFTAGTPWLPVPADHVARSVDVQRADPGSVWHVATALLALRGAREALRDGAMTWPTPESLGAPDVLAFDRRSAQDAVRVLVNTRSREARVQADGASAVVFRTASGALDGATIRLDPDEAMVVAIR